MRLILAWVARVRVWRPEFARVDGPYILAANHISHFDPPFIGWAVRQKVDWMTTAEFFENPLARAWFRAVDCFPVNREKPDREAIRTALDRLARGRILGMFPEGGIRDGERSILGGAPIRPGISMLAQMSGAPVVPCVLLGTDRLYDPKRWRGFRRAPVWIGFSEPIRVSSTGREARAQFEEAFRAAMAGVLEQMKQHFNLDPSDLPQPPARRKGRVP